MAIKKKKKRSRSAKNFNNPIELERILSTMMRQAPHKAFHASQLRHHLEANTDWDEEQFGEFLQTLCEQRVLQRVDSTRYRIFADAELHEGIFLISREGYGVVFVEDLLEEVMITEPGRDFAFHGDRVRIQIIRKGVGKYRGAIDSIIQRKRERYIGTIDLAKAGAFFIPQETKVRPDFYIPRKHLNKAQHGDKVVVELTQWNKGRPEGRVIEVIGSSGTHSAEMHAILMEFGLEAQFPPEVEKEAQAVRAYMTPEEIASRRDFRSILTFTIDPIDAKDFDDALSFEELPDGNYSVGIHIADVSFFVREGTHLDREAYARGTSVYLVDRTVPMLPEQLSNDLCSLVPHEDRLTFAAVFTLTPEGQIIDEWFGRTVIHSSHRFTYEEAQMGLDTGMGPYAKELQILNDLAYKLRKERFAQGSIDFDSEEVRFKLDAEGVPIEVYRKERKDAHRLVEDFMLLANRRVAAYVAQRFTKPPYPFVYRIHAVPERERLEQLQAFVAQFGHTLELDMDDRERISRSINQLVVDVMGRPEQYIVQSVAIRSMPKAIYTTKNIGHYGLGFRYYSHFTSPIRRYPDLLVHRQLDRILNDLPSMIDNETLESFCRHCSDRERTAADAERASIKYKQVEYLALLKGKDLDGLVSGLTDWGIYVEIDDIKCEGMIPLRDLRDDHYQLDQHKFKLIGQRTGKTFRLGQRLRVRVKKTNILKRTVDFELIERLDS
jgi:ribonuclease R